MAIIVDANITEIDELVKLISKLPGLGPKSTKEQFKLINNRDEIIKAMANTLAKVYKNVTRCNSNGSLKSNIEGCANCENIKKNFTKFVQLKIQLINGLLKTLISSGILSYS